MQNYLHFYINFKIQMHKLEKEFKLILENEEKRKLKRIQE